MTERADSADVEAVGLDYSFVADAKVFRLSRTAKNQKDFKIQAMDGWKRGKPFAMVICPIYQLPSRQSQIYEQASSRNVCIFSYSHLAVLAQLVPIDGNCAVIELLHNLLKTVEALTPSKDSTDYWQALNRTLLNHGNHVSNIWRLEKMATIEAIKVSKDIALTYYATERENIMRLTHDEALNKILEMSKIDKCEKTIQKVSDNHLMNIT